MPETPRKTYILRRIISGIARKPGTPVKAVESRVRIPGELEPRAC